MEPQIDNPGIGSDPLSPNVTPPSSSQLTEDQRSFSYSSTFARDLCSTLLQIHVPFQQLGGMPGMPQSRLRQPNNSCREPNADYTVQGLHNQHIDVLGEVFVST